MKIPTKTLLMIRARAQAADFVAELSVPNPVIFAPMVRIDALNTDTAMPETDIIIFTSSNAVRHFTSRTQERNARVLCVGSVTMRVATKLGFNVLDTFMTANALVTFIQNSVNPEASILYPRAETVSVDIKSALFNRQNPVHELILYRQTFLALSTEAKTAIESSALIVPILSKQIAKQFHAALISLKCHDLTLVCLSAPVAAVFDDLSGISVEIAQKPTRAALIKSIKIHVSV